MNRIILCLAVIVCVGCQSTKQTPVSSNHSSTEVVTVTISKVHSSYEMKAEWIRYESDGNEQVLAAPMATGRPNEWTEMAAVQIPRDYAYSSAFWIDGDMVRVPSGFGTTLKFLISPKGDKVNAKGVFAANKVNARFEVPFSGLFEVDVPTIIYEQKEYYGADVYTNVVKAADHGSGELYSK